MGIEDFQGKRAGTIEKPTITSLSSTYNKGQDTREAIINCSDSTEAIKRRVKQAELGDYERTVSQPERSGIKINPSEIEHLVMRSTYEVDEPQKMPRREEEEK